MDRGQFAGNAARSRRHHEEAVGAAQGGDGVGNERVVAALADAYGDVDAAASFAKVRLFKLNPG